MARDAFVLKIQRELCHPKTFGTFKTETGPGATTLLYAGTTQSHVPFDLLIITALRRRTKAQKLVDLLQSLYIGTTA